MAGLMLWRGSRDGRKADIIISFLLIAFALRMAQYMLGFAGWYDKPSGYKTFMFYFPFHLSLLTGPLIYFYFKSLTNFEYQFTPKTWRHFYPGFLMIAVFALVAFVDLILHVRINGGTLCCDDGTLGKWGDFNHYSAEPYHIMLGSITELIYTFFTLKVYYRYRTYLQEHFSNTDQLSIRWLRAVLLVLLASGILFLFWNIFDHLMDWDYSMIWFKYLITGLASATVGISAYSSNPRIPKEMEFDKTSLEPSKPEPNSTSTVAPLYEKLLVKMEMEKLYLDPTLSLKKVADLMKTNTNDLSKAINKGAEQHFNDFVNAFRVEHIKKDIEKGFAKQRTLTSIAFDAGFNSKSTFNRAFKKRTGVTPKAYQDSLMFVS